MKRHVLCLELLQRIKNRKLRKAILVHSDSDLICSICECAWNILRGNVSLTPKEKSKLRKYKKHLRTLASKKVSTVRKRKVLQTGGFLSALLAPLAGSILIPLLRKVLG